MGLFSKFSKKSCKEELLLKVLDQYNLALNCMDIEQGTAEMPTDWQEQGFTINDAYVYIVNDINELIFNIHECQDFPLLESNYWGAHLNAFAGNLLFKARRMYGSKQYFEASINIFSQLAEEFPEFQYFAESQIAIDVTQYTADIMMHLSQVRRDYVSKLTKMGQEKLAEEVILENLEYGEKHFAKEPNTFLSYSEDLEQAGDFYRFQHDNQSQSFYKKAIEIVESRADLKTHMDNNDSRLFRLKYLFMTQLELQGNESEAIKVEEELSPYYENRENDEEMLPLLKTPLDQHITAKSDSLGLFNRINVAHETYNSISSESDEEQQLELFNWCCNEFSELISDSKNFIFPGLETAIGSSRESKTLLKYWSLHCQAFLCHIYNRAHRELEVAEDLLLKSISEFIKLEKNGEIGYPSIVPWTLITDLGGVYFNSTKAYLSYAGNLSQQDKKKEAGDAYLKAVDNARQVLEFFNADEKNKEFYLNKIPAGEKPFENLALTLNKAGEFFRFPQGGVDDQELAVNFFKEASDLLEENIANLETFMQHEDIRLLQYKDNYAFLLRLLKRDDEQKEIEKEIEPYKEYITWRIESNIYDM